MADRSLYQLDILAELHLVCSSASVRVVQDGGAIGNGASYGSRTNQPHAVKFRYPLSRQPGTSIGDRDASVLLW